MGRLLEKAGVIGQYFAPAPGRKVLYLIVTKKWFDMITREDSKRKREEYRAHTAYWQKRIALKIYRYGMFTHVHFRNGYQPDSPTALFTLKGLRLGRGRKEWGADLRKNYYCIELGERVLT